MSRRECTANCALFLAVIFDAGASAQRVRLGVSSHGWLEARYEDIENNAGTETVQRGTIVIDSLGRQRTETGREWSRPEEAWVFDHQSKVAVYVDMSTLLPARALRWIRRLFGLNPEIVRGRPSLEPPEEVIAGRHIGPLVAQRPEERVNSVPEVEELGQREIAGVLCMGFRVRLPEGGSSEQWLPMERRLSDVIAHFYTELVDGERRRVFRIVSVAEIEARPELFAVLTK